MSAVECFPITLIPFPGICKVLRVALKSVFLNTVLDKALGHSFDGYTNVDYDDTPTPAKNHFKKCTVA